MKPKGYSRLFTGCTAIVVATFSNPSASAASATWNGTTSATWADVSNWAGPPVAVPGAGEIATFNNGGGAVDTIDLGAGVTVGSITFDTAAAAAYTLGAGAVGSQALTLGAAGSLGLSSTVTANQLVNANLNLPTAANAAATLSNNSTGLLTIAGGIVAVPAAGNSVLNATGSGSTSISGAVTETGAGSYALLKTGAGTLTLTNGSVWSGSGAIGRIPATAAGFPLVAREGTLLFNGGTHAVTGELVIGGVVADGGAGQNATIQVDSGTVAVSSWLSVGRGNGVGAVSSNLTLNNNAAVTAVNFSAGFNGGAGTNLPKGTITLNGTSSLSVTNTINFAESGGSNFTLNLNGTSTFSQTANANQTRVGGGDGAVGVINVNGGTASFERDLVLGYTGTGSGKLVLNSGAVNVASATAERWLIMNNVGASSGELTVNGGTLTLNNGTDLRISTSATAAGTSVVNLNGGAITGINAGTPSLVDLKNSSNAGANNTFNLNGGILTTAQVITSNDTGTATFNFNGGTLRASAASADFFNLGGATQLAFVKTGGAIIDTNGFNVTAAQALEADIGGSGGLTKLSAGTLTLTGFSTYTGATTITGGTLALGGGSDINTSSSVNINGSGAKLIQSNSGILSSPVTLTNGTLDGTGTIDSVTVADSVTNVVTHGAGGGSPLSVGSLAFNDAATVNVDLTLSFGSTAIDTTTLNSGAAGGGKITINASNTAWTPGLHPLISYSTLTGGGFAEFQKGTVSGLSGRQSAVLADSSGTISLNITGDNPVWTGAANGNWTTATIANPKNWALVSNSAPTDYINGDIVLFDDTAPGTSTVTITDANVSPVSTTFNNSGVINSGKDYVISGAFGIATGSVILNGEGPVTLASANTYAGGTIVNAGTLNISHASAIGTGPLTITGYEARIDNSSGSSLTLGTNNVQNWNNDFIFSGSNDLNLGAGAVVMNATRSIITEGTATFGVGGAISGTGAGLTKLGTGVISLGGANTYTGGTLVNNGTLVVTATGAINSAATANVGEIAVAEGSDSALLRLSGGTINATKTAIPSLSAGGMGSGSVIVDSGTLNVTGELWLGKTTGAYGSLTLNSGAVNVGSWLCLSRGGGTGILNVRGGALTVTTNNITVGTIVGSGGNAAVATFSGGVTNVTAGGIYAGELSPGVVNLQPTSTVNLLGALGLRFSNTATTSSGIVNLNGGILTTPLVSKGPGLAGNLNLNGGTLKASASTATFMEGLTEARVHSGGAVIDTGTANNITVAQPLLAATGTGVTSIALTVNGTGYLDTPLVTITGGTVTPGGVGATAVANINPANGQVTGVTVTNPGSYTDASGLAVIFSGGGGVAPTVGTIITGANTSGGLNVLGTGSLTLTGVNTYTGATNVTAGALAIGGAGSINGSSAITVNGTGARFAQASSVALGVPVTVTNGTFDGAGAVGNVTIADSAANVVTNGNGGTTGMTVGSLVFNGAATLNLKPASTASPVIAATSLTTGASGTITINASNTEWNAGTYNLITYTGAIGGGGYPRFALGSVTGLTNRQAGSAVLSNPAGAIALTVGDGAVKWTGKVSGAWTTAAIASPKNWSYTGGETDFLASDLVRFDDSVGAGITTVDITDANVSPFGVTFANSTVPYTIVSPSGRAITGTGFVTKNGTGTVVMDNGGLNNYTGATTLNGGVFSVTTIANGGLASDLGASTNAVGNLVFGGGTLRYTAAAAPVTDRGFTITPGSSATFDITSASANLTVTGATPATTGSLVKAGAGKLTLTGATLHTGGTVVSGGTLESTVNGLNGGAISIATGATLTFTGNNQISTSTVTGGGAILNNTANTIIITGDHTGFTGSLTHTAAANNTQFGSAVSGSENATYSITGGEYIFAANGDYTVKMGSLSSTAGVIRGGNAATGTTTLEIGNLGGSPSVAGSINNGTTKILALTKVGGGTLTIGGTNSYSGLTNITGGTLRLNGALTAATGVVTVASGATLAGNGNIAGNLTIQSGGHHALAVAATPGAQVTRTVGGMLDLTGIDILDLAAAAPPASGSYTLVTATGGITGVPDTINYTGIAGGSVNVVGNSLVLTVGTGGFSTWISGFGLAAGDQDPTDDPDNDGFNNLMEYVLSGNPSVSGTSIKPTGSKVGSNYVFIYNRSDLSETDTVQTVEYGDNLTVWGSYTIGASPGVAPVSIVEDSPSADQDTVTVTIPTAGATKFFARLKVVK